MSGPGAPARAGVVRCSRRAVAFTPAGLGAIGLLLPVLRLQAWSSSAWLFAIAASVVALLVTDGVWAAALLRRPHVEVRGAADATVGEPSPAWIRVERPGRPVRLRMSSLDRTATVRLDAPGEGVLDVVPEHRGVFRHAEIEVSCSVPLGLVTVSRRVLVLLDSPVHVGPRPVPTPGVRLPEGGAGRGDGWSATAGRGGEVRGVREHAPGDSRRLVHWPATARAGRLVVKDVEAHTAGDVVLVVDLGPEPGAGADEVAGRAAWLAAEVLARGGTVVLCTAEGGGDRCAPVASAVDAGRRLACAEAGRVPAVPARVAGVAAAGGAVLVVGPEVPA